MKWTELQTRWQIAIFLLSLILILALGSFALIIFSTLSALESFRIIFGSVFVLFLPGFLLTYAFFPIKKEDQIDWLERIALSFALSIAVVPLVVFYLNLVGLKISTLNTFLVVLGIIIVSGIIAFYRNKSLTISILNGS